MKNKKIIVSTVLFLLSCSLFAQQKPAFYIGFRCGAASEIMQTPRNNVRYIMGSNLSFYSSPFELDFSADFSDYYSVMAGISYKEYQLYWKHGLVGASEVYKDKPWVPYFKSMQIPIRLYFNYPLFDGSWKIFTSIGVILDIPLHYQENVSLEDTITYNELYEKDGKEYYLRHRNEATYSKIPFNILLETGVGCSYTAKSGWRFYATAEYNMGFRSICETDVHYTMAVLGSESFLTESFTDKLLFKGDYWSLSLGVQIPLKRKR